MGSPQSRRYGCTTDASQPICSLDAGSPAGSVPATPYRLRSAQIKSTPSQPKIPASAEGLTALGGSISPALASDQQLNGKATPVPSLYSCVSGIGPMARRRLGYPTAS